MQVIAEKRFYLTEADRRRMYNTDMECQMPEAGDRKERDMSVQGETRERTRIDIREPKQYQVIMHNDDFTPMDFVVELLRDIFHKDEIEAVHLMMMVHEGGRASVGTYPRDIAVTKVQNATARAREKNYPFRMTIEET